MENIFKNLFSRRHGLVPVESIIVKDRISPEVINAIGTCYDVLCDSLNNVHNSYYHSWGNFFLQQDIERELGERGDGYLFHE